MPSGVYKHKHHQGFQKGQKPTEEVKRKIGLGNKGEKCSFYIDGRFNDKDYYKKYRQKHKKEIKKRNKKYQQEHKKERSVYRQKIRQNPKHRLDSNMGKSIWEALRGKKAGRRWETLVGYTLEKLMQRLSVNFQKGMNFKNYGRWEIDHIKPKSLFRYKTAEDQTFKDCWSLANLQPLWAKENLKKGNHFWQD